MRNLIILMLFITGCSQQPQRVESKGEAAQRSMASAGPEAGPSHPPPTGMPMPVYAFLYQRQGAADLWLEQGGCALDTTAEFQTNPGEYYLVVFYDRDLPCEWEGIDVDPSIEVRDTQVLRDKRTLHLALDGGVVSVECRGGSVRLGCGH